jgi:hypothetical protein
MTGVTSAPARGTQLAVSDPQHLALTAGALASGYVNRGGRPGDASITTLYAMAKRHFVTLVHESDGRRLSVVGARLTPLGYRRLAELDEAASQAARLARIIAGT